MKKIISNLKTLCIICGLAGTVFFYNCGGTEQKQETDKDTTETEANTAEKKDEKPAIENEAKFAEVSPETKSHISNLLTSYLALKDAFVATDAVKAQNAAKEALKELTAFDVKKLDEEQKKAYDAQINMIKTHNEKIAAEKDVEKQRVEFEMLSMHTLQLVKDFGANENTIYKQFCPMAFDNKGAFWISDKEEIRNPYFGDKMLKCGRVDEKLAIK